MAVEAKLHRLTHARPGVDPYGARESERSAEGLVGRVGPVALVLGLEGVSLALHLDDDTRSHLVGYGPDVVEELVRGNLGRE